MTEPQDTKGKRQQKPGHVHGHQAHGCAVLVPGHGLVGPVLAPERMARVMALAPKPQAPKTATTTGTAEDRGTECVEGGGGTKCVVDGVETKCVKDGGGAKFVEVGGDAKCAQGQRRGEGRTPDKKPAPGCHPFGAHPLTLDDTCAKQGQVDEEGVQDGGQNRSSSTRAATALVNADDCELSIPGEAMPTSSWGGGGRGISLLLVVPPLLHGGATLFTGVADLLEDRVLTKDTE
ncbi:hypothetical protein PHYSODRAFT_254796 [Phytophthora sojae]|uniref:Uncharacterized protein n=1 Tax=Phytophthora sojae (strain P6497) TaxID=1094619 RepID=G4Z853_PHYSP|nr:hypothetical protein PHYSODRAFT_254796 [Phytophthora sojae]EGZ19708.1 hypothetical protein PHYSODRAFT_254796 [Phytophthora sojae]|eukprot:XP_009522425.1 hypothetical protein PHYSODRAFT_254796 [Phytophthora sojae]